MSSADEIAEVTVKVLNRDGGRKGRSIVRVITVRVRTSLLVFGEVGGGSLEGSDDAIALSRSKRVYLSEGDANGLVNTLE